MRFRPSRRAAYVLAAVAVVGGLLELLAGRPATSRAAADPGAASAVPTQPAMPGLSLARESKSSKLAPATAKLLFALARRTADTSDGGNMFAAHTWHVARPPPPPAAGPPAEPTAPPLPYAFVGSYAQGSNETVYFLTRGDRVYDVKQGDRLDGIYSIDGVENGQLIFTYMPLNIRQTLPFGGGP